MNSLYSNLPLEVPPNFTKPNTAYRVRAWLAVWAISLFLFIYFGSGVWLAWRACLIAIDHSESASPWLKIIGIPGLTFLSLFILKPLFSVKLSAERNSIEINRDQQPHLFAFIEKIADDAKAPRPHKVVLSPGVNACVYYDLNILNLFFSSKKNLDIGLGLVNVLSISEFKAVIAHEFGHFSQRSMAVGRWVYVAQQIAGHIVHRRDAFDNFLNFLSRTDLRIAWTGWVLKGLVWAIRGIVDISFRGVFWAQRALSQEMEFHADRVAVSISGSEAIVNALYKLTSADEAWESALEFSAQQLNKGKAVSNVYAMQTRIVELLREIYDNPQYGLIPEVAPHEKQAFRLFKAGLGNPPKMWLTHPRNYEREGRAKETFIPADQIPQSAWQLFSNAPTVQEEMSMHIFSIEKSKAVQLPESLEALNKYYTRPIFDRRYHGLYMGRSITRRAKEFEELYEKDQLFNEEKFVSLYSKEMGDRYSSLRNLRTELMQLRGIHKGFLEATGERIIYQGQQLSYEDLDSLINSVQSQVDAEEQALFTYDRQCRTLHREAAQHIGNGWPEYLEGLLAALHYAEHGMAYLHNECNVMRDLATLARRKSQIDEYDMKYLVSAAGDVRFALTLLWEHVPDIHIDENLQKLMGDISWAARFEDFTLASPSASNIGQWLDVIDSWVNVATNALWALREAAIDLLLNTEATITEAYCNHLQLSMAPAPSVFPRRYKTLLIGTESTLPSQIKMDRWWDRFCRADGKINTKGRVALTFSAALAIVALTYLIITPRITIYNGLGEQVNVKINWQVKSIPAHEELTVFVPIVGKLRIEARTTDRALIEEFDENAQGFLHRYIYNVASAGRLLELHRNNQSKERVLSHRWIDNDLTLFSLTSFEKERAEITDNAILIATDEYSPERLLALNKNSDDQLNLIRTHANWDSSHSLHILLWLQLANEKGLLKEIIDSRLQRNSNDMAALLSRLKFFGDKTQCEQISSLAAAQPSNMNIQYLKALCLPQPQRAQALLEGHQRWPDNGWFGFSAGYTYLAQGDIGRAHIALDKARGTEPAVAPLVALDVARLRRSLTGNTNIDIKKLAAESDELYRLVALEHGEGIAASDIRRGYQNLKEENILAAYKRVDNSFEGARLFRLIAASDSAPESIVKKSLALAPDKGIDAETIWPTVALMLRNGQNPEPLYAQIPQDDSDNLTIKAFIQALRKGQKPNQAAEILKTLPIKQRAIGFSAGAVYLDYSAPDQWRRDAKLLLFSSERPRFIVFK